MLKRMMVCCALPLLLLLAMPPRGGWAVSPPEGFAPGPDVIMGNLPTLFQAGSNGTQVGLMMGTDICNNGDVPVNWFRLPETDHPVIPQNLYRMSGGANNDERFEQIGQSWAMHQFFPLQNNACLFGCTASPDSAHLGVGCSTADSASINASQSIVGSRAWVNPYTGIFPSTSNSHTGHTHNGTMHRILVEGSDLNPAMNQGATYYGEAQLVTAHESAWCQGHAGECNMFNNVSHRQFAVTGTTSFNFSPVGDTVRTPAIFAWPGATIQTIEPAPGVDGRAFIAYKVTQIGPFEWHYEYAIYNQNLDRGIQFFSVPAGCGIGMAGNLGFHAPLNHPGIADDGTVGNAGYSNVPWSMSAVPNASWSTETFAQNPNANAIRWGTSYNFRFDGGPPILVNATIGFFKTGAPITVSIPAPVPECAPSPTPPPPPTPTPTPSGTPSPTPTPTPSPTATASASPTATPCITYLRETFDQVSAPALPAGWVASFTPGPANCTPAGTCAPGTNWTTNAALPDTAPNSAFHDAPGCVTDSNLDTPVFSTNSNPGTLLSFRHAYSLDTSVDGAVLEISISGGPFTDISEANGFFLSGGYNGGITTGTGSPIGGRPAWTGNSGGYITTTLALPGQAASHPVKLRFRLATDCAGAGAGWRIDTIAVTYGQCPPTPTPNPTPMPSPPTQTVNLSTRMLVETGDRVGIGGFIITGNDTPKHVLIRAIGPSLTQFGLPNALADTVLELHGPAGFTTITNDNWRDTQEAAILATGIAPANNLEAAIDAALNPGAYTAILRGKNNTSGVALVEVYDLNQSAGSRLANMSTRAFVFTGDNIVIAGFMLAGDAGGDRIVVRGLGPSMTAFGIPSVVADPTLELRDVNGALLIANNDWQDNPDQAGEINAVGLAPFDSREAAIIGTFAPGLYTALLAGRNNGTGSGLVEVYDLGPP